jgi:hypothetical protein
VGVDELGVGALLPELPVLPVLPVLPELPLDEDVDPPVVPVPAVDPDPVVVPLWRLLAPGCSWATTIPMATVAPATARTATRVSWRRRAWALSRLPGVLDWMRRDMCWENLCSGDAPWHHARIDVVAGPAVGLL